MKKTSSIIILSVITVIFVLLLLITIPLNGRDKVQVGKSDKDFTWIIKAVDLGIDLKGGFYAEYECYFDDGRAVTDDDIAGAMSNLKDILFDKGYSEAVVEKVTKSGNTYVRVEVAGLKDTESLMSLIGNSSTLTFRDNDTGEIVMTGTGYINKCVISTDDSNSSYYSLVIQFNNAGTQKFADVTTTYKDKPLAIYIDDTKIIAPTVNAVISNGVASITGKFTYEQAYEYQVKIQAGISETKLKLYNSDTVSASLGSEALKYSLIAAAIGLGIIIILLILIYRGLGLAASCALLIYTELLIVLLALVPWVELTISGIAGVILSIGMAVDANVIIFERIKEVKRGSLSKGIRTCVKEGFNSAFITILDANITTIIGTIVMIIFGSSSVKSFAITLLIGILLSMFTAILVTRTFINCFVSFNDENEAFFGLNIKLIDEKKKDNTDNFATEGGK
ncbi:MAG: SecD/SecF family protein translocase subunit [Clostridia bacterium]|nr:SecD/SecF family protein translocase subunit [Clostridia bacterium]